jgi:alpha,alpha-trehalase
VRLLSGWRLVLLRFHKPAPVAAAAVLLALSAAAESLPIADYIMRAWTVLTRSNRDLAAAAVDPKFRVGPSGRWPVYVARTENLERIEGELRMQMPASGFAQIDIRRLPEDLTRIREQGLLYLPKPYVVPGGRFNEMYGWDSYFIQLGLLRDGEIELAKDMADNFVYEIRQYGQILNANRTYYLTRSQPPFLTEMLLEVYRKTADRKWLAESVDAAAKYYDYWMSEPHLTPQTGLSRYMDLGEGPSPEVLASEINDTGHTHYDLVREYFRTHRVEAYDVSRFYDRQRNELTPAFYKADRSMRESGFDPSARFGPFNADIVAYDPVCLNSLLYVMEKDMAEILQIVGRETEAPAWRKRAEERAERVNRLMWDARDGIYYDYNFEQKQIRRYPFLTTFYPLWAGIASAAQAARVRESLGKFERPGGLRTSTNQSGDQWDAPFGWAPLHLIAVEGLRRYGYNNDADRIAEKFLSMAHHEFRQTGTILEKYDVERRAADIRGEVRYGYSSNEVGFGWTNGVFKVLLDELSPAGRAHVLGER